MKHLLTISCAAGAVLIMAAAASAAGAQGTDLAAELPRWRPDSLAMNVLSTVIFGAIGVAMAIVGFKLFDLVTPGKLQEEICEKQNLAAGILGGAIILGISIIIAAAVY